MPLGNLLQGYEAARKGNLAESGQELQQFGSLQNILAQHQALQEQAKIRALISGGGSPEQIVQGLLQSGPNGAAAAHQYATAIKELGTAKAIQGLSGSDLTNPDVLLKSSMIPGMGHLGPEAERLRKVKENAAALATYREAPQPMPVGTPVPGTTMQTTAAIPPEERAAFDKVAQAAAQGQVASAAPQPGDISRAPKAGGLFADLMSSEFPAIANQAKTMQAQLNASGAALPAQHWIDLKNQLATHEATMLNARSMVGERPLSDIAKLNADLKSGRITKEQYDTAIATKQGTPEAIENMAQLIANRQIPALSGFAMRSPMGMQVMARLKELAPDYQAGDFQVALKAEKDFSTGKQGNTVRSFNVGIAHLNTLDKLADALHNGNIQQINRFAQEVSQQTGGAAPTNFNAAKKIVGDEIVKAIVGAGGGVSDREEVGKQMARANSPAQLKGVISTYKELMNGQLGGLQKQYEAATRKTDFRERFLSEAAKAVSGGSSAATPIDQLLEKYK